MTRQSQTTAQGVIASLALPAARPAPSQPASPLPLSGLHPLPRDASMLYDIGRVDDSGRVASNEIINALQWRPGSKLEVILTPRTIVIRTAPGGRFRVPQRPRIIIPPFNWPPLSASRINTPASCRSSMSNSSQERAPPKKSWNSSCVSESKISVPWWNITLKCFPAEWGST